MAINELRQSPVQCPYCGESINVLVDCSVTHQDYIEDCQVCCRPIDFSVTVNDEGSLNISASHEDT